MTNLPVVLVLSSWLSGSNAVVQYLDELGAYVCKPLTQSDGNRSFDPYESEEFRSMLLATIDETNLEFKVDRMIFRSAFKDWFDNQLKMAESQGAEVIVLHHPLSIFLIDEISEATKFKPVVVTRKFSDIESSRKHENWNSFYGELGALEIYNQIYETLHQSGSSYLTINYEDFMDNSATRWLLLDYCEIDVDSESANSAYKKLTRLPQ